MSALRVLAYVGAGFVLLLVLAFCAGRATAHDPYSTLRNPATGAMCCNSGDCRPVDAREVGEAGSDYTWRGSYFPKRQTQPSPDEQYHICAYPEHHYSAATKWIIRCLLRPSPGA